MKTKLEIRLSRKFTMNGPETVLGTFQACVGDTGGVMLSKPQFNDAVEALPGTALAELRQLARDHARQFIKNPLYCYTFNQDHCIETFVRSV